MSGGELVARVFMDTAAELDRIEGRGMWRAPESLAAAALASCAAARCLPYDTYRELAYSGVLGPSPYNALQTLVGLGLETELGTDMEGTR